MTGILGVSFRRPHQAGADRPEAVSPPHPTGPQGQQPPSAGSTVCPSYDLHCHGNHCSHD